MMKNENGMTRFTLIVIIFAVIAVSIIVTQIVLFAKNANNNSDTNETIIDRYREPDLDKLIVNETEKKEEKQVEKVEELEFTQEYLQNGKTVGDVKIQYDNFNNIVFLSITGNSNNDISKSDSLAGKNRWYRTIDITKYNTLEFYARKGKDNGDLMIFIDDTIIQKVRYTELPTTWTKYKVNIANYTGEHTISIAGGYADNSGSVESNTQYCSIKLK